MLAFNVPRLAERAMKSADKKLAWAGANDESKKIIRDMDTAARKSARKEETKRLRDVAREGQMGADKRIYRMKQLKKLREKEARDRAGAV
jgi:hypothetical protein